MQIHPDIFQILQIGPINFQKIVNWSPKSSKFAN
jgi:hypothetical protein